MRDYLLQRRGGLSLDLDRFAELHQCGPETPPSKLARLYLRLYGHGGLVAAVVCDRQRWGQIAGPAGEANSRGAREEVGRDLHSLSHRHRALR